MDSSMIRIALSACSSSMMSGGDRRIEFSPEPSVSKPRWKALSTTRSRRSAAFSLVFWSRTNSTPIMSPLPRTSPTVLKRCGDAHRVSPVRGSVRAGLPLHDAFFRNERADRHATGNSLRGQNDVRRDSRVIVRPPLPRPAHSGLHFVDNQHDSVPVRDPLQFLKEECRCGNEAAFALDRFHDDRRHFLGRKKALEDLLLEQFNDLAAAGFLGVAERTAVRIGIRDVLNSAKQGAKSLALGVLGSR